MQLLLHVGYNSWPAVSFELAVTTDALMAMKRIMKNNDNASFPLHEQLVNRMKHTITRWQLESVSVFPTCIQENDFM